MKVIIRSGNDIGKVVDMPDVEATSALATGYAELYVEPKPEKPAEKKGRKAKAKAATRRRSR